MNKGKSKNVSLLYLIKRDWENDNNRQLFFPDLSRIRHNHMRESMKARLGWTINKHGGELFELFVWCS